MKVSTRTVGITAAVLIVGTGTAAAFAFSNDNTLEPINTAAPVESGAPMPRPAEPAIPLPVKPTPTVAPGDNWENVLHDGLFANYAQLTDQTQGDMCTNLRSLGSPKQIADFLLSSEYGSTSAVLGSLYVTPADLAVIPANIPPYQVIEFASRTVLEFCRA